MLEKKYSTTSVSELIKMVLIESNLEALMELQDRLRHANFEKTGLHPLDILLIYYIDLVWMPEDLRRDFYDLHGFVLMEIKTILTNHQFKNLSDVQALYSLLFSLNSELETDEDVVLTNIIAKGLYHYTDGKYGFDVEIKNIDNILCRMTSTDYSRIPDDALKLLCLAYYMRDKIFSSQMEKEFFTAYMSRKRLALVFIGDSDNQDTSDIFDKQNDMFLMD